MPRTKRAKALYQRGRFCLYRRPDRKNLEIIWYDHDRRRERSASAGTSDLPRAKLELDRRYLEYQGHKGCPTCGGAVSGDEAPLLTSAIRDYLILSQDKAGYKTTRSRLAHVIDFVAETDLRVAVPHVDERFVDLFRKWLAGRPVLKGQKIRPRSLGHIEGCVRQLAAAINATKGQRANFKAEQPRYVSRSPTYRADIPMIAKMFRFCIYPTPPEGRHWSDKEKAMVFAARADLLRYLRAAIATWARPGAIFDIKRDQWYPDARVLDLNSTGRRQSHKFRPMIPVAKQFAPSLDEMLPGPDKPGRRSYLVNSTVRHGWESMRKALSLPGDGQAGEKLIRRSVATIARKRMASADWPQGRMMLGHEKFHTSDIYAVPNKDLLGAALEFTETIIDELEALCPGAFTATLPEPRGRGALQRS